ncbi:hypothetical protein [Slackia isoflavoniconvertens]|uniref:hypothetical protein n=1 Tax=Slackia isoflavoniconvertens TaxID=572010 RepID=UPI003079101B
MSENKKEFVNALNAALIACGGGRYDRLETAPLAYVREGCEEYVVSGDRRACVTGDSLTALMKDVAGSEIF